MSSTETLKKEFVKLLETHSGILYKICRLYTSNNDDYFDLRQEILFQLWKSFSAFKGSSSFSTWMYRISLNTALMKLRSNKRKKIFVSADEESIAGISKFEQQSEDVELLYGCIKELSSADKALILLKLEGYSSNEISEIIGISTDNVNVRTKRIKEKLKKLLIDKGYNGG